MTSRRPDPVTIRGSWRRRRADAGEPFPGIAGPLRHDRRTKHLVKRLHAGDVAVIDHADIDRVAAEALVECRPSAVLNMAPSISGRYPTIGPTILVEAGIPLLDEVSGDLFELREGSPVQVDGDGVVWHAGEQVGKGLWLELDDVRASTEAAKDNLAAALEAFTVNTLEYVHRDRDILLEGLGIPPLRTHMRDRHVLVVVRGYEYKRDLETLRGYIREYRPVLIGVDGGADALLEARLKPDVILGDMDSVSSQALACGAEIVVHAYPDGRAPGLERVKDLGLEAVLFPGAGTSEDMALLLAYEAGCDLIVAVGAHTSMVEFLEKGRPGMASTFLVRLKVGGKLVDAKGVNRLYREGVRRSDLILMVLAALAAMLVISLFSAPFRVFWEDVWELCKELIYRMGRTFEALVINLRYHIVSLVAVFLALAIGIVMGATVLNKSTASVLNVPGNALRIANERYRTENAQLRDQNSVLQRFGEQELPGLVAGRLAGRAVVVVDTDQVPDDARTSVATALQAAGAQSVGRLTLSSQRLLLTSPSDRQQLSEILGVATDNADELRSALEDGLAARLSAPARLTKGSDSAGDLLNSLTQGTFLSLSGLPAPFSAGTTPFPPARPLFVVAGPSDPSPGVAPTQLLIPLAGKLAAQTLQPVVGVEVSGGKLSWIGPLRGDQAVSSRVSTVDDIETVPGQFSLVLALQQAEGGAVGHYGVRTDADRLVPQSTSART